MKRLALVATLAALAIVATPAPASADTVAVKDPPMLVLPSANVDSAVVDSMSMLTVRMIAVDSLGVSALAIARDSVIGSVSFPHSTPVKGVTVNYRREPRTVHRQRPNDSTSTMPATASRSVRSAHLLQLRR